MGTDVERIVASMGYMHELWATVIEVGVAIYLLARQVSVAAVVPVVICLGKLSQAYKGVLKLILLEPRLARHRGFRHNLGKP
jgi:membrane-bound metal-dependent hydrolase YbcI (DUF457 family)